MNRINKQNLSMFSKETLDSLEMAEVLGGDNNTNCSNTSSQTDAKIQMIVKIQRVKQTSIVQAIAFAILLHL